MDRRIDHEPIFCSREGVPTGQLLRDQPHDGLSLLRLRSDGEASYLECERVAHHHAGPLRDSNLC
jgi:hypothetical protein